MPGAHKIGAPSSGPRIAGGNYMDTTLILMITDYRLEVTSHRLKQTQISGLQNQGVVSKPHGRLKVSH